MSFLRHWFTHDDPVADGDLDYFDAIEGESGAPLATLVTGSRAKSDPEVNPDTVTDAARDVLAAFRGGSRSRAAEPRVRRGRGSPGGHREGRA